MKAMKIFFSRISTIKVTFLSNFSKFTCEDFVVWISVFRRSERFSIKEQISCHGPHLEFFPRVTKFHIGGRRLHPSILSEISKVSIFKSDVNLCVERKSLFIFCLTKKRNKEREREREIEKELDDVFIFRSQQNLLSPTIEQLLFTPAFKLPIFLLTQCSTTTRKTCRKARRRPKID